VESGIKLKQIWSSIMYIEKQLIHLKAVPFKWKEKEERRTSQ